MQMPMPGLQTGQMAQGMVGQTLPPNPSAMMEAQAQKMAQAQALQQQMEQARQIMSGGMEGMDPAAGMRAQAGAQQGGLGALLQMLAGGGS
jgi:uncharacterized protein YidB (DUF937 family)